MEHFNIECVDCGITSTTKEASICDCCSSALCDNCTQTWNGIQYCLECMLEEVQDELNKQDVEKKKRANK